MSFSALPWQHSCTRYQIILKTLASKHDHSFHLNETGSDKFIKFLGTVSQWQLKVSCHYLHIRLILVSANHAHFIQNCERSGSGLETCIANLEKDIVQNLCGSLILQILQTFNCSQHFFYQNFLTGKLWFSHSDCKNISLHHPRAMLLNL